MLYDMLIGPFVEFEFMRRALVGTVALSLGGAPIGVILMLRRMALTGDAMSHAILPGTAVAFLLFGLQFVPMTIGGIVAGVAVAVASGLVARATALREDSALAAFYLISLSLGVILISLRGSPVDLIHILFGSVLALDDQTLILLAAITTVTLLTLALIWRPLILDSVDPGFLRSVSRLGPVAHVIFLVLVVLNLVAGFNALGTLLAVGLMMLPAIAARFWVRDTTTLCLVSGAIGIVSGYAGLVLSYNISIASGPAIVVIAGGVYLASLIAGPRGGLIATYWPGRHRAA